MSEESEAIKDWLLSVGPNTRPGYMYYLTQFCKFVGLTPDQLIQEGVRDRRAVHRKMKEWYAVHKSKGLASKTRLRAYTSIRSFLNWNDIPLGRTPYPFRAAAQYETQRILTANELSMMITISRMTRDKAIISFLAQSGQRTGILRAMRYGLVREQLEKQLDPILVRIPGDFLDVAGQNVNKIREKYEFAIGKECAMFLRIMMKERVAAGEKITDDSWLFRSYAESQVRAGKYVPRKVKQELTGPPMSPTAFRFRVVLAADRAGIQKTHPGTPIRGKNVFRNEIHPHMFRRWWKFQMRKAGVTDVALLEHMMGQKDRWLLHGGTYDVFDPDYIKREYARAEPHLTVLSQDEHARISRAPDLTMKLLASKRMRNALSLSQGSPPQKVVTEWELDSHLAEGWKYIATLPSGRVIVEN